MPLFVSQIILIACIFRKHWYSLIVLGAAIIYLLIWFIKSIDASANQTADEMSAKREQRLLDSRAKQLRIGMPEEVLIQIMGEPLSKQPKSSEEKELWLYEYIAGSHIWRVFLNTQERIIVQIHQSKVLVD